VVLSVVSKVCFVNLDFLISWVFDVDDLLSRFSYSRSKFDFMNVFIVFNVYSDIVIDVLTSFLGNELDLELNLSYLMCQEVKFVVFSRLSSNIEGVGSSDKHRAVFSLKFPACTESLLNLSPVLN